MNAVVRFAWAILNGRILACWNWPPRFGGQYDYYDGWHACLHCGVFSVEIHF